MNFGGLECLQSKYLQILVDQNKPSDDNLLDTSINDSDDLLNLLATEDDCSAILQNIASNEQFERLITTVHNDPTFIDQQLGEIGDLIQPPVIAEKIMPPKKPQGEFKCAQCDKICTTKKLLRYHLTTHSNIKPYSCEICGKHFRQKHEVTAHMRSHNKPSFQCDICSKMFIHKSHLSSHRRKHSGDFVAFCTECNRGFVTQSSYKQHIKVQHEKVTHICDVCGLQLSTLSALNEHKVVHESNYGLERAHVCETCGKSYLTARNLKTHMKSHSAMTAYICNICGKSLSSKKVLETHIKSHIGEKDFVCEYCNKSFAAKGYLTTHLRVHTGDKPYQCRICDKAFSQRTTLTVHMRYHTGERPYKCHCGKGFITKSHLVGHYKTHEVPNLDFSYIPQQL